MSKGITQKEALDLARTLIDSNPLDAAWKPEDVYELSRLSGTALRGVVKRKNPKFPNDSRHLHVLKEGHEHWYQWSWLSAIKITHARDPEKARVSKDRAKRLFALRFSIQPDLNDFRDAAPQICADLHCGRAPPQVKLTTDHVSPPFIEIAEAFLKLHPDLALYSVQGCGDLIADPFIEAEWIAFHASRAVYQVLCLSCNASKGARDQAA